MLCDSMECNMKKCFDSRRKVQKPVSSVALPQNYCFVVILQIIIICLTHCQDQSIMAATSTTSTASDKSCFAALSSKRARKLLSVDAQSLSKAIEKKQVSCEELMQATLARIHEVNPKCNAIILLRKEQELLAEARLADQTARKGWLHGIPIAVKDLCNVKGIPTTLGGSPLSSNFVSVFLSPPSSCH